MFQTGGDEPFAMIISVVVSLHSNIKMEQNFKIRAKLFIVLYTSFFVHNKCSVFTLDLALLDTSDGIKR